VTENLKRLMMAQFISTAGDQLTTFATFGVLLKTTGNPIHAASALLLKAVIGLVFGITSLRHHDRIDPKKAMIFTDALRVVLLLLIVVSPLSTVLVLIVQGLCNICEIYFNGSRESVFVRELKKLSAKERERVVAFDNQVLRITELLGFGVAFAFVAVFSYQTIYLVDALTFLLSIGFLFKVVPEPLAKADHVALGIKAGFLAVARSAALSRLTVMRSLFWAAAGMFNVLFIKLASEKVSNFNPVSVVAAWDALLSIGMVFGLYLVQKNIRNSSNENPAEYFLSCALGTFAVGSCMALIPLTKSIVLLCVIMLFFGAGMGVNSFAMRRIKQTSCLSGVQARVTTVTDLFKNVSDIAGMLIVIVFSSVSYEKYLYASGIVMGLAAIIALGGAWQTTNQQTSVPQL
jgi:hypothetical protein